MSRLFSTLKGDKSERRDLNPSSSQSDDPPAYTLLSVDNPPPYHDWQSVPDTALLPPPPSLPNDYSKTSNASYDSAAKAHEWCRRFPVYQPKVPSSAVAEDVKQGRIRMDPPDHGSGGTLTHIVTENVIDHGTGTPTMVYHLRSRPTSSQPARSGLLSSRSSRSIPQDQIFLSALPLYFAALSHPFSSHYAAEKSEPFTIYFEIRLLSLNSKDASIAIGFAAKPYPPWRQPGWQRASIGVHSDDGRRFANDPWGGTEFVDPFQIGDVIGMAIVYYPERIISSDSKGGIRSSKPTPAGSQVRTALPAVKTRAYLTRNGKVEGSWAMNEERDAEKDEGIEGLQGEADMYAAIGTFGDVEAEIRFFLQDSAFVAPRENV